MPSHRLQILNGGSPNYLRGTSYNSWLYLTFASSTIICQLTWFTGIKTHRSYHIQNCSCIPGIRCPWYAKTKHREYLHNAHLLQKQIWRHLPKLGRRRWRYFCSSLDPRKFSIWKIMRNLHLPTQLWPFRALTLYRNRSELEVGENLCEIVPQRQSRFKYAMNYQLASPSSEYDRLDALFSQQNLMLHWPRSMLLQIQDSTVPHTLI